MKSLWRNLRIVSLAVILGGLLVITGPMEAEGGAAACGMTCLAFGCPSDPAAFCCEELQCCEGSAICDNDGCGSGNAKIQCSLI